MKEYFSIILFILSMTLILGCAKKKNDSNIIMFNNTDETVKANDIDIAEKTTSVEADFNLDGLKDLAVVHKTNKKDNEVAIYIQQQTKDTNKTIDEKTYYKAGVIRRTIEGNIIGIASRNSKEYVDLLVLITHTNEPNEMIHYQNNNGTSFKLLPPSEEM